MADWWDSIPDTPVQAKKNWWDDIPDGEVKPPSVDDVMTGYPKGKEPQPSKLADTADTLKQSAIAGLERGVRGLAQAGTVAAKMYDPFGFYNPDDTFALTDKLKEDEEKRRQEIAAKPQTLGTKVANVLGGVTSGLLTLGTGEAGATGQDIIDRGGNLAQAVGGTLVSGAANTAGLGLGALGGGRLASAGIQALVNPALGAAQQATMNTFVPESMKADPLDVEARLTDALTGAAMGGLFPSGRKQEETIVRTGDPYIDAGQAFAANLKKATERPSVDEVAKKRDAYLENPPAEKTTPVQDLFSPEPELGLDMFSGEAIPASKIESRRQAAQDANQGLGPQRTVDEIAALEREYILDQQDKINALQQQTANVTAKQGDIPEPYLGIANADLLEGNPRQIQTRNGEAVGVVDQQPSGAMREAFLRGLAERGQLRNDPVPVERPPLPERDTFEPSKVPTVEQRAEQPSLELPTTQDLFQGSKPEPRPEPARAPEPVKTAPESSFIAAVQKANEDSVKATGKPLTAEAIQALRDKYNKEAPRVTEEQKQAHEQKLKELGVDAFDQPGHNVPEAYYTNTADVVNELEQSMGKDWPKVKESIDNGKLKIIGSVDQIPEKSLRTFFKENPEVRARGWFSPDGTATMLMPNVEKGTFRELLFHEVGGHGGLQQRPQVNKLMDRVLDLAKQGNIDARQAVNAANAQMRVLEVTANARKRREVLAYFIQYMSKKVQSPKGAIGRSLSLYNSLKAEAKLMLADKFGWDRFNITDKDMYALAEGSIRKFSKTGAAKEVPELENEKQVPADFEATTNPFHSALLKSVANAQGLPKTKITSSQLKGWLDGAQRRGEFKQSERNWLGIDAWLDGKKEVTKQELVDFIRENQVQVNEIELTERNGDAVFHDPAYNLPGGKNYREILLTLPGSDYTYSHWLYDNVFAHVRLNERTDADGKRVLFVEEVQSDWHQSGRKKGYADETNLTSVPSAPLKKEWPMVVMKRMIRYAAENGFDRIAWTTGDQQVARYPDLSKNIDKVVWTDNATRGVGEANLIGAPSEGTLEAYDRNGNKVISKVYIQPSDVQQHIGKDLTDRLFGSSPIATRKFGLGVRERKLQDLNTTVGGEGMKAFYDKMLPNELNKYVKKWDVRVKPITIDTPDGVIVQPSIDVTPAMRDAALESLPLFDLSGDKRSQGQPKEQPRAFLPELEKRVRNLFTAYGTNVKIGRDVLDSKDITGMGQRVVRYTVKEFDKAGINKLPRDLVNAALDNDKQALAQLSPKQQTALKNFRNEVEQLQLRLAAEHPTLKGVDMAPMILESVLKGDYNTRTYRAYTSKPSLWYSIRRDVFGTAKDPYWIEQLAKKAPEALANAKDFIYQNIAIPDPKNLSDAQVREYASWWNVEGENIDSLREQLAEKRARYGEDLNTQTRQIMRDFVERNDQSQVKAVKQVARNPSILMERHNLPEVLRTFLGEEKDPTLRAAFTLSRLGDLLAQQTTLTRIAATGEGKYLFRKGQVAPEGFKETIPDNDDYGALRGMSTSKDMLDQLRTIVEVQGTAPAQYVRKTGAELFKLWTRNISGPSKLLATVGSHATSLVNFYSNVFGMARGTTIRALMGNPVKAVADVAKAPWLALLDEFDKLPKEQLKRYAELGITGDSWQFGELKNTLRDVDYREKQQQSGPIARTLRATKRVTFDNPIEVVKKLYAVPDVALRINTFVAHADALRKIHPDWTIDQIERLAADKAKDEVPTFSRATPLVKGVSGLTGNFATWSSEVVRTTSNQFLNAVGDIREGYQTGNKQQVRYGLAQLSGTAAYMTAAKLALPALIAYGFGISKKENPEKDNKNASQLAPSFYEGNDLQVVQTDPKTHKIILVNTSRVDPANPINEIYNRVNEQIEKQGIMKGIPSATAAFIYDNYLRPGPMAQAAYQSITNQDQAGNVLPQGERLSPIIKALTPGTVKNIESAEKIRKRSLNDQLAFAKEMGIPMYELDGEQALKSKLYDFRKQTTEAAESFKKAFAKPETLSEDDLKSLYADYVAKEKELFDEAQRSVRAGKETFGLTPSEIQSLFKDTSVEKDYRLPMTRGEFQPKTWYSDDFLIKAEKRAIQADPSNRDEIRRDFQKRRMLLNKFRRNWKELE